MSIGWLQSHAENPSFLVPPSDSLGFFLAQIQEYSWEVGRKSYDSAEEKELIAMQI